MLLISHFTKRTYPPPYELALECQKLLYDLLCISFIVSDNPIVFSYMWNHQICSHYQGFVTHFRFTADEKFYPKKVFMGLGQKESFTVNHYFLFKYSSRRWLIHKKMSHNIISQLSEINKLLSEILLLSECTS